ncbi:SLA1 homology domain 1, SHD1 [Neorhodopirellula lusitana]|uniref:SLA1 homology domain 1, SHD1 n=1 Tax=Neorhodopirellula lusitana TaxID=445327 RepID=A0ABY1PT98_9BACT|nr:SHD1 domain-containing protein [Neorhodopirellula lusitana]SMP46710.1 SLA1 homology domain 1, SHD1 [Neorhodopirellula lusitana]
MVGLSSPLLVAQTSSGQDEQPREPTLTYSDRVNAIAEYKVTLTIGTGAEAYSGELQYTIERLEPGEDGAEPISVWGVKGKLETDQRSRMKIGAFGSITRTQEPLLGTSNRVSSRIKLSSLGRVLETSRSTQLELVLGDLGHFAIWPLPQKGKTKWEVVDPLMVQQSTRDQRFPRMPFPMGRSPFDKQQTSAAIESAKYELVSTKDFVSTIRQTYELKAEHSDPPFSLSGSGEAKFDQRRGIFTELNWSREVLSSTEAGAEVRLPVQISVKLEHDVGFLPLTPEQKIQRAKAAKENEARMAKARAEAEVRAKEYQEKQRLEKERPFTADELKKWMATFDDSSEYSDTVLLRSKLMIKADREEPELAQSILEYANRLQKQSTSFSGMFVDLAAKFDPKIKEVADLRKKLSASHARVTELGDPIDEGTPLHEGQLVLMERRAGSNDYRPKLVVRQDGSSVWVRDFNSKRIEDTEGAKLCLPPARVLAYLPEEQRPKAEAPFAAMEPDVSSPLAPRTWKDRTGRFSVEAAFLWLQDGKVGLKKSDGGMLAIPLDRLSPEDQAYSKQAMEAANPFKAITAQ